MVNFKLRIWAFTSWNQITTSEVHTTAIRRNKAIGGSRLPVGLWSNTDQVLERKSKISSRKSQGKMLLTSCPYVEKSLTIFWSKLAKCYWYLVYIYWKKFDYILTPMGKMLLTSCQYIGKRLTTFLTQIRKILLLIDSLSICWQKVEYMLIQIGKILLTSSQYIGESLNIFWLKYVGKSLTIFWPK